MPVLLYDLKSRGSESYLRLAGEIMERIASEQRKPEEQAIAVGQWV
jgi:cellulose biosynthesis protein BcsQ